MAPPVFYHMPASPCSRGALLAAKLLGVPVEVREMDLFKGDHLKPDFVALNPMHTVPTLDDNGFVVADSHAIATYLADRYGRGDHLYPRDAVQRSLVDQRLYFDAGVLYMRLKDICFPVFFRGADTIPDEKKQRVHEALGWLEGYLAGGGWVAGAAVSIADALCVSSVTTCIAEGIDVSKYPKVLAWIENCRKTIPDFDLIDKVGADKFQEAFRSKLKPGQLEVGS